MAGDDSWFWHVLALTLGRTVGELQRDMSQREFVSWQKFYRSHPFDDAHRYHRPAALIAGSFGGGGQKAMQDRLEWLRNEQRPAVAEVPAPVRPGQLSEADINTMRALMGG